MAKNRKIKKVKKPRFIVLTHLERVSWALKNLTEFRRDCHLVPGRQVNIASCILDDRKVPYILINE